MMPSQPVAESEGFCEKCGAGLVADSRFCEACGRAIGSPPPVAIAAAAPDLGAAPTSASPRASSSRVARLLVLAAAVLVLASFGGWWLWSRATAPGVAPPPAMPRAPAATPAAVDPNDAQYRAARVRLDVAYKEYKRLLGTGSKDDVAAALQEYRRSYAEVMRTYALRKGSGTIR